MNLSVLDIFKVGVGPSSSHTMGPMNAACAFVHDLEAMSLLGRVDKVAAQVYGSLALTGRGHCTDRAILLGLEGNQPATIDPAAMEPTLERIRSTGRIRSRASTRSPSTSRSTCCSTATRRCRSTRTACASPRSTPRANVLHREEFFSTGGGFIVRAGEFGKPHEGGPQVEVPHPFTSAHELLEMARSRGLELHELMLENERAFRPDAETRAALLHIWSVMDGCIERGFEANGLLPGVLKVRRRASRMQRVLLEQSSQQRPLDAIEWVNAFALAVNEENAAGGRVVTAPTNGAAGIVPAVLAYYRKFEPGASENGIVRFLLVAGAIGMLYKRNASISGAEMGCQGEVGVACSMAAAGLVAAMNGTNEQVENAAEIGMEHNLGLTCDPIAGLVQIPCIERNAMGAVKAINAARLSMRGDGTHKVSLDQVIATMRQTGHDMSTIYKETSQGGLAVNVPEC